MWSTLPTFGKVKPNNSKNNSVNTVTAICQVHALNLVFEELQFLPLYICTYKCAMCKCANSALLVQKMFWIVQKCSFNLLWSTVPHHCCPPCRNQIFLCFPAEDLPGETLDILTVSEFSPAQCCHSLLQLYHSYRTFLFWNNTPNYLARILLSYSAIWFIGFLLDSRSLRQILCSPAMHFLQVPALFQTLISLSGFPEEWRKKLSGSSGFSCKIIIANVWCGHIYFSFTALLKTQQF